MLTINGTQLEGVEEFQSSDGYCLADVRRCIGLASAVMASLRCIWKWSYISLRTKVHMYRPLVMSVLLCSAETWTLLVADLWKMKSLHVKCLRPLLCVSWRDRVNIASVLQQTGLMTITSYLSHHHCLATLPGWTQEYQLTQHFA